jgi:hypothetical protein
VDLFQDRRLVIGADHHPSRAAAILDGPGHQQDEPLVGGVDDLEGVAMSASPIWGETPGSAQRRTQSACQDRAGARMAKEQD